MLVQVVDRISTRTGHLVMGWNPAGGLGSRQRQAIGEPADHLDEVLVQQPSLCEAGGICRVAASAGSWSSLTVVRLDGDEDLAVVGAALGSVLTSLTGPTTILIPVAAGPGARLVRLVYDTAALSLGARQCTMLVDDLASTRATVVRAELAARAVLQAREWTDAAPNILTPSTFVEEVVERSRDVGLAVRVVRGDELVRKGYGGLVAVGGGSSDSPALIRLDLIVDTDSAAAPMTWVGKGVTFDSGGLSLKTTSAMATMKRDMAGAAAVAAAMIAVAGGAAQRGLRAYLPVAENLPGPTAYRPGDVVQLFGGVTVEVDTTDAEGRLIVAEAMTTAGVEGAGDLITVGTLTGSGALGPWYSGVMGDGALVARIVAAGDASGERLWPMPLPSQALGQIRAKNADLHQVIPGHEWDGPMLQAGVFLSFFAPQGCRWAHIDIAGQVTLPDGCVSTGVPARTLVDLATRSGANV